MNYAEIVIYGLVFLAGFALLPGLWYVLGKEFPRSLRTIVTRILWTIGALVHGPHLAYWRDNGRVEIVPANPEADELYVDGEWIDMHSDGNWSRLGKTAFGVAYEKDREAFEGTAVEPEEPDEGDVLLLGDSGAHRIATRFRSTADNIVVDLRRVTRRFRGAAGGQLADAAKKDALVDYGGKVDMETRWIVIGIVSCLALGAMSGWLMFGV